MTRPKLLSGDVREVLKKLEPESVQCVVTSPPYWGLRDYGTATWEGGDINCDHTISMPTKWNDPKRGTKYTRPEVAGRGGDASACHLCGAKRVDSQLGLEKTPDEFVKSMVDVFREVKRVLRKDGTVWMNLGDTYGKQVGKGFNTHEEDGSGNRVTEMQKKHGDIKVKTGLPSKNLVGIPWRVALALQADGWILRSDIIWHKPNPMPESVKDRPTKSHEYIFLLTKSQKYYYDNEAIKEKGVLPAGVKGAKGSAERFGTALVNSRPPEYKIYDGTRNKRTVWPIATKPYPEAHFATFPEEIPEICIKAGTKKGDIVLDPFVGSGTTCAVASRLGRNSIGIDLNEEYLKLARKRLRLDSESLFKYV